MEQGWLVDRYKRRALTLEELTTGMCAALTLEGKPKVIIIQHYLQQYVVMYIFVHVFVCVLALTTDSHC